MAVDAFKVVKNVLRRISKPVKGNKIVALSYDEDADVLYVKFRQAEIVDSESLDPEGMIMGSLDKRGRITGLIIMNASRYSEK